MADAGGVWVSCSERWVGATGGASRNSPSVHNGSRKLRTPALISQGSVRVLPKAGWLTLSLDATSTRGAPQPSMRGAAGLLLDRPLGLCQQRVHRAAMG